MDSVREGDILAGKYRVEQILGEGGMGVVVAAWHIELDERVAIKFLLPEHAERGDSAERFRREARAAVKIKSEHVARVTDVGTMEDTGVPYMVMEFLDGHDLAQELELRGFLPVHEVVSFMLQACEALAEAHALGIVHRDLKPANLFVTTRADGQRMVKVLDFGISKSLTGQSSDMQLTKTQALIGSPLYMSPEQMDSAKDVDQRTDIWSLGAIMYELLTGHPPYTGQSIPQLCAAILNSDAKPLMSYRPEIAEELDAVVQRCLAKSVELRWQTVGHLARALEPYAPREAVHSIQRVQRVLEGSRPDISGLDLRSQIPSQVRAAAAEVTTGATAVSASFESAPSVRRDVPDAHRQTIDSWGRTGDQEVPAKRSGAKWAVAGAAALLFAAGGIYVTTQVGTNAPASAAAAPAAPPPAAETAPAKADKPAVAVEPAQKDEPADEAKAEGDDSDEVEADEKAEATKPEPAPVAKPTPVRVQPRPATKPQPKPSDDGLTDFGGRR